MPNLNTLIESEKTFFYYKDGHIVAYPKGISYKPLLSQEKIEDEGIIGVYTHSYNISNIENSMMMTVVKGPEAEDWTDIKFYKLQIEKPTMECNPISNLLSIFQGKRNETIRIEVYGDEDYSE